MHSPRNAWLARTVCAAAVLAVLLTRPAEALVCVSAPVTARGDFSRFEWTAKAKARATWRHKVRINPSIGGAYAEWGLAKDPEERCIWSEQRVYCIFAGTPCRR